MSFQQLNIYHLCMNVCVLECGRQSTKFFFRLKANVKHPRVSQVFPFPFLKAAQEYKMELSFRPHPTCRQPLYLQKLLILVFCISIDKNKIK